MRQCWQERSIRRDLKALRMQGPRVFRPMDRGVVIVEDERCGLPPGIRRHATMHAFTQVIEHSDELRTALGRSKEWLEPGTVARRSRRRSIDQPDGLEGSAKRTQSSMCSIEGVAWSNPRSYCRSIRTHSLLCQTNSKMKKRNTVELTRTTVEGDTKARLAGRSRFVRIYSADCGQTIAVSRVSDRIIRETSKRRRRALEILADS